LLLFQTMRQECDVIEETKIEQKCDLTQVGCYLLGF